MTINPKNLAKRSRHRANKSRVTKPPSFRFFLKQQRDRIDEVGEELRRT